MIKYDADYEETYRYRMQIYDKMGETDKAIDDAVIYFEKSDAPQHYLLKSIMGKHLSYALAKVQAQIQKNNDHSWKQLRIHIYKWGYDYANAILATINCNKSSEVLISSITVAANATTK